METAEQTQKGLKPDYHRSRAGTPGQRGFAMNGFLILSVTLLSVLTGAGISHAQVSSSTPPQGISSQDRSSIEARRQQYILSYMRAKWERVEGEALDIAAGGPSVYRVGKQHGALRYRAPGWEALTGNLLRLAVSPKGQLWGITAQNEVQVFDGQNWQTVPGKAKEISIDRKGRAVVIDSDGFPRRLTDGQWKKINAPRLLKITAGATSGQIYAVSVDFKVVRYVGQGQWWTLTTPDAIDLSFGYGALWIAGRDGKAYKILQGGNVIAKDVPNGALHIAVGPGGVWVVNRTSEIYRLPVK